MKKLLFLGLLIAAFAVRSAPPLNNQATLRFTMIVDNTQMGGLSTNDYSTNFSAVIATSTNLTSGTNGWSAAVVIPVTSLLVQGPPGTLWSWPIAVDNQTRFFMLQYTNISNGGVGPFSQPYPLFWTSPSGAVGATK